MPEYKRKTAAEKRAEQAMWDKQHQEYEAKEAAKKAKMANVKQIWVVFYYEDPNKGWGYSANIGYLYCIESEVRSRIETELHKKYDMGVGYRAIKEEELHKKAKQAENYISTYEQELNNIANILKQL